MRKLLLLLALSTVAALIGAAPAGATAPSDRYAVPTGGSSSSTSCQLNDPCTLDQALKPANINDGDVVHVAAGDYTVANPLTVVSPITVVGAGVATTRITSGASASSALVVASAGAVVSDLALDSGAASATLLVVAGAVQRVQMRNSGGPACSARDATIAESVCAVTGTTGDGLLMNWSGGNLAVTLRNSTFIGNKVNGHGLELSTTSNGSITVNAKSIIATGPYGVDLYADSTSSLIFDADHSNYPDIDTGGSGTHTGPAAGSGTNQLAHPIFTSLAGGIYTEAAGSPTIDAGAVDSASGTLDLAGIARSQGAAPDIGAYEFPVAPPFHAAPDVTPPIIGISKKPKSKTKNKKLRVVFTANEAATFQCKLDKGKFKTCKSPYKKRVKLGKHKLQIRATDAAGNVSKVKTIKWTVKKPA